MSTGVVSPTGGAGGLIPANLAAPAFTLGTSNVKGAALTVPPTDSTILAFDATTPAAVAYTGAVGAAVVAARRDHAHALGLTTGTANLGGDVTMTSANTFYDGGAVVLGAGTWLITGAIEVTVATAAANVTAKLWDGTTVNSSAETLVTTAGAVSIALSAIVTAAGTYKISAARNAGTSGTVMAAAANNGAGNNASFIRAVRIA